MKRDFLRLSDLSIDEQIQFLRERAHQADSLSAHTPRLDQLLRELEEAAL